MIFMKYWRRGNLNHCEVCLSPIKWMTDGIYWYPCDAEPVLFYPHAGKDVVFYRGELLRDCRLFRQGEDMDGVSLTGHRPHVFKCQRGLYK